jgi:hypothetical protein
MKMEFLKNYSLYIINRMILLNTFKIKLRSNKGNFRLEDDWVTGRRGDWMTGRKGE